MEKNNNKNRILLGDVVRLHLVHNGKDEEEKIIKLVDYNPSQSGEIVETSINSLIGKAIYQQEVGKCVVVTNNNYKVYIIIKEKIVDKDKTNISNLRRR